MAVIIRLVLFVIIAVIGVSLLAYVFTRDRKYLAFAWRTFKYSLLVLLVLALFIIFERLIIGV
ncbi:MAG: hypothetical protein H7125_13360 [Proteobacteria bacterium]|nr:hypothetical protein [Burkholderiales bacterium]